MRKGNDDFSKRWILGGATTVWRRLGNGIERHRGGVCARAGLLIDHHGRSSGSRPSERGTIRTVGTERSSTPGPSRPSDRAARPSPAGAAWRHGARSVPSRRRGAGAARSARARPILVRLEPAAAGDWPAARRQSARSRRLTGRAGGWDGGRRWEGRVLRPEPSRIAVCSQQMRPCRAAARQRWHVALAGTTPPCATSACERSGKPVALSGHASRLP